MATESQQPVSAQVVGNAFAQQYYQILYHSPEHVHRFYQDISKLGRQEDDGSMSITTTMKAISEKILSLNYGQFSAEIKTVDAQESYNGGVHVLVTGDVTGKDTTVRNFTQSFFLAPQNRGYFVLNDILRYVDTAAVKSTLVNDAIVPIAASEPVSITSEENHVSGRGTPNSEEHTSGEVYNPPENGNGQVVEEEEEEEPVAEVLDEVPEEAQIMVESDSKIEEVPKKSYASIVMHLKESAATFSPPPAGLRKAPPPKNVERAIQSITPATDGHISSSELIIDGNNLEGVADGHSIYVKGLPMNATEASLEEVFKKFGAIKPDGIQVRSNRQQGFCFGFVEFEDASSVQKALEASPVTIGGRQSVVEEKKSTNSRGNNNRGRFQYGRNSGGFRNEGIRGGGRGNYGGGRGEFNGNYNNNRGGVNRPSSSSYNNNNNNNNNNRERLENFNNSNRGGRVNRNNNGGMANSISAAPPPVSASS